MSTELVSSLEIGEIIVDIHDHFQLCVVVGHTRSPMRPYLTILEVLTEMGFMSVWEYEPQRTLESFYVRRL